GVDHQAVGFEVAALDRHLLREGGDAADHVFLVQQVVELAVLELGFAAVVGAVLVVGDDPDDAFAPFQAGLDRGQQGFLEVGVGIGATGLACQGQGIDAVAELGVGAGAAPQGVVVEEPLGVPGLGHFEGDAQGRLAHAFQAELAVDGLVVAEELLQARRPFDAHRQQVLAVDELDEGVDHFAPGGGVVDVVLAPGRIQAHVEHVVQGPLFIVACHQAEAAVGHLLRDQYLVVEIAGGGDGTARAAVDMVAAIERVDAHLGGTLVTGQQQALLFAHLAQAHAPRPAGQAATADR
uniref:NAD-specific glutamate dehydrogenase n=1 Tax=Steinernema glaseri TaxID=37863 RepID=A0A1I7YUY0_9BILA